MTSNEIVDGPRVHEIHVGGFPSVADALAAQEPIARLLCPDPEHNGPCAVPWEFTLTDAEPVALVLGVYADPAAVAALADRVRTTVGEGHPVQVRDGDPEEFPALVEQHRVEHGEA
ncbi:hypothetical protein SAMN05421810_106225 [Amycolatopsis arida]|uniref:Uncharacterized protein n=1 Tax=Amycolatopsis arida TaxID=587909 RepID=A0A1I5XRZ7_9PSEU|nr:hypothetical protein [Amycolatopsis arida]TDX97294.1 hypothetical protein CLV69_102397 [Amycolatopsis arida]SFQ34765.1 hypothetical protein SAMN05421810_106225 [Amycolatopsis arida]